jgi:hypothetical protein
VQQTLENKLPHRNNFLKRGKKTSRGRVFVSGSNGAAKRAFGR